MPTPVLLAGLILPLGLDTLALAAALGMAGLPRSDRARVTALFTGFEMAMPLLGLALGAGIGALLGGLAAYAAVALLAAIGGYMLWPRSEEREGERLLGLATSRGLALLGLGLSISVDELALGLSLGLLHQPLILAVLLIGLQALVLTQLGLRLGGRAGEAWREWPERLAGVILLLLGAALLVERIRG